MKKRIGNVEIDYEQKGNEIIINKITTGVNQIRRITGLPQKQSKEVKYSDAELYNAVMQE